MTRTVLVAGGGTAGHVFPAIAVAKELMRQAADVRPVFIGAADRLEARLVPEAGFPLHTVEAVAIPRRPSLKLFAVPTAIRAGVGASMRIAEQEDAVAVVTFGGYVSFPVDRAAGRLGLPLVIHEQNSIPGLTNRVAARWADRIAVSFPGSAHRFRRQERCSVTGNPVREDVLTLDRGAARASARERFGLAPQTPTLLVFGGSQGARSINRAVVAAQPRWSGSHLQVLHAAGRVGFDDALAAWAEARQATDGPHVEVVDFIDDMPAAYAAADVVVCRAGATSIAELTVLGIPAVLVPYPHATADHQTHNARALERAGGAVVVEDGDLDADALVAAVAPLFTDPARYASMARACRAYGRPDAAANVARLVLGLLDDEGPP